MKVSNVLIAVSLILITFTEAFAISKPELDKDAMNTLEKCYTELKGSKDLIQSSSGALVFPEVTKGGIGIAIESGKGALVEHGKVTGYYETSAASVGATVGVGSKSIVIAFRTPEELAKFKASSGWDAGMDAGVAVAKAGASGTINTENIKEPVVGFIFGDKGLLADVSLKGSKISRMTE